MGNKMFTHGTSTAYTQKYDDSVDVFRPAAFFGVSKKAETTSSTNFIYYYLSLLC